MTPFNDIYCFSLHFCHPHYFCSSTNVANVQAIEIEERKEYSKSEVFYLTTGLRRKHIISASHRHLIINKRYKICIFCLFVVVFEMEDTYSYNIMQLN